MTTKQLFLNKQLSHQNESSQQFLNLNLNQNNNCSDTVSSLQSYCKSNNNKCYGYISTVNYQRKDKSTNKLTFKTSKNSSSINDFNENETKHKRWMNDKNDCPINIYNSTLSLHIAAYENSIDSLTIEEIKDLSKKSKAIKKTSPSKFQDHQDIFEFPRQMECNEQNTPIFMQFKASQKLFLPIQDAPSSNQILPPPLISNQNCPVMLVKSADGTNFIPFALSSVLQQQQKGGSQGASASTSTSSPSITITPEVDETPLYVNAKQYQRILKRRIARAKLIESGRIPKERTKYLHESRHQHALKRARGEGGKFDSKTDSNNANSPNSKRQRSASTISNTSSTTDANKSKDNFHK